MMIILDFFINRWLEV